MTPKEPRTILLEVADEACVESGLFDLALQELSEWVRGRKIACKHTISGKPVQNHNCGECKKYNDACEILAKGLVLERKGLVQR
jgi:hypothetical protein